MGVSNKNAHVLIVDDEPLITSGLSQYLRQQGYSVSSAQSVKEALSEIEQRLPDLVLLDLCMPEISGLELLAELRQDPQTQTVPVIVTSALTGTDDIVGALRAGANDYVTKPIDLAVLLARVERHLELGAQMGQMERIAQMQWQMTGTDDLSGICNRRFLLQTLDAEIYRSQRYSTPLTLLVIEMMDYAQMVEDFGQTDAENVLRQFLEGISGALRRSDKLCRYEGEQFCAILPQTDFRGGLKAAWDIREWIQQVSFTANSNDVRVGICIGLSSLSPELRGGGAQMVDEACRALEAARHEGSNRIASLERGEPRLVEQISLTD